MRTLTKSTPTTATPWTKAIRQTRDHDNRLSLIQEMPIVAWFSKIRGRIHRLIKVRARLGDNAWIIVDAQGFFGTLSPTTLDACLRTLTAENGWVLCEFTSEADFYRTALAYLEEARTD